MNLNGTWKIYYDENLQLEYSNYFSSSKGEIEVPSAIETVLENRKFSGPYYYEKVINIDTLESEKSYLLKFDGVSYYCEVYLNDKFLGSHEGIWDSFKIDVSGAIKEGNNKLVVKVIKPDFNKESKYFFRSVLFGFIPDVSIPYGGIWKDVTLEIKGENYLNDEKVLFDVDNKEIVIETKVAKEVIEEKLIVEAISPSGERIHKTFDYSEKINFKLDDIELWTPSNPKLYSIEVKFENNKTLDVIKFRGGFRKITSKDGELVINDEKFYMRGILHWGYYPEIFTPMPSYEEVKEELRKIKELGFNTVKHCLYFPPKYYYDLCDEMGIVTWQELPLWLPYDNGEIFRRIDEQYPKMLDYFLHHPSIVLVSLGCELDATIPSETLNKLYEMIKKRDGSLIICDNSGSGECFEGVTNSSSDIYDYHFYGELFNLDTLINEFTRSYRERKPWLFGEYNDIDTFRLVDDIEREFDYDLWWLNKDENKNLLRMTHKGFNSDLPIYNQREILDKYKVKEELQGLKDISYRQAYITRKYILELTRSYNEIKGYNITAIRDVPITTSGIFDDKMNSKFDAEEFRKINGDIVVSLSKNLTRIWDNGSDRFLNEDLYNYISGSTLKGRMVLSNRKNADLKGSYTIKLTDKDKNYFNFEQELTSESNSTKELCQVNIKLPEVKETKVLKLEIEISYEGDIYKNQWDIWVYPNDFSKREVYLFDFFGGFKGIEEIFNVKRINSLNDLEKIDNGSTLITTYFDKNIEKLTEKNISIVYFQKGEGYFPVTYNPFYREGIKKIFDHPVVDSIGHLDYAGLQFFGIANDRYFDKLELEEIIGEYSPIIRRYDGRKFTVGEYIFEYKRNGKSIIVTSLNFDGGKGSQPYSFKENALAKVMLNEIIEHIK